ncbi:MAG: elongation factor G [Alphaproteobacteria bacterium]|nr:elongation factor G [Alphaproteobacteria bacterium]
MSRNGNPGPRCAALVGPYLSGKTTLLESILSITGATTRKGTMKDGNTVGDASVESRARKMSVELNVGTTEYLGDKWTFIDCPGSIELIQETVNALAVVDCAVVVYEPSTERALTLAPLLKYLDDREIPYVLFVNKMDVAAQSVRDVLESIQAISSRPLVLRQVPIRDGDKLTGYVDLVSERAYRYKQGQASDLISIPESITGEEREARQKLLESLADFDDQLLEKLLEEAVPPPAEIYEQLSKDLAQGLIIPVMFGAAEHDNGVRRLLKLLRHEVPPASVTAERHGIAATGEPLVQVFKTFHASHTGKLSVARVWRGPIADGATLGDKRIGALLSMLGGQVKKLAKTVAGDIVALGRMDEVKTGAILTASGKPPADVSSWPAPLTPVFTLAIVPENRADEVKLTGALQRLGEEDPSVSYLQSAETRELLLRGQGEIHLQIALDKLRNRYNVSAKAARPSVPYKETIRKPVSQHGRFKRQTGGHGMFGDVHIDIKPVPRGGGFQFNEKVVGGSVPRNFIPAVEAGVREFLDAGPLGFPVVDVAVTLTDGQYHTVDSNEMSFKLAARVAMSEGMPKCEPVLLEPIVKVEIDVPNDFTNKVHSLISTRRGQILGYVPREGWSGWDTVQAHMPQSEIHDLIVELRSLTQGVGTFHATFDHLQELTGRLADQVIQSQKEKAAVAHA